MRVLILGGGAVGLGLASCLIKAGAEVHIVARAATARLLREEGLRRGGIFGDHAAPPGSFGASSGTREVPLGPPFDFILVCVKSFDTPAAAADLARAPALRGPHTRVILCQNGWGNRETFLAYLPGVPLYSARVITGFSRPRPNEVEITVHADPMHVGTLGGEPLAGVEPLCTAITAGGLPCEMTPWIGRDLWAKMLYNCSLNPLGAIFDVPYGALADSEYAREIMNAIHEEVFQVMRVTGHETHWADATAYQRAFYGHLVPSTAVHCSSTLQDIRAGKRTEIDALNGAIVTLGQRHRIAVPVNTTIYRMVKFQEARHLKGE
jgi:2-dehydropantoate 2-reductase